MPPPEDKSMRRLGRWVARIRSEFLGGLHGERVVHRRSDTLEDPPRRDAEGRVVTLRRTTIEEIRIREDDGGTGVSIDGSGDGSR